jgi:phage repressor protein C with HTH and peptisase S24 domain
MNTVSERLVYLRGYLGLNQPEAATRYGIPYNTYRKYEHGLSKPGADAIEGISRAGINSNWLLTGEGPMFLCDIAQSPASNDVPSYPSQPHGFVAIPLFDVRAAAGGGSLVDSERVLDVLHFKEEWIRAELRASPADLYLIFVDGESMEPTLRPGDVILVDRRDQAQRRDGIYVLRLDGTLLVKRLQKLPGGVIKVSSDNRSYEPFSLKLDEMEGQDMAIIGRVVWVGRKV